MLITKRYSHSEEISAHVLSGACRKLNEPWVVYPSYWRQAPFRPKIILWDVSRVSSLAAQLLEKSDDCPVTLKRSIIVLITKVFADILSWKWLKYILIMCFAAFTCACGAIWMILSHSKLPSGRGWNHHQPELVQLGSLHWSSPRAIVSPQSSLNH